MDNCDCCFVEAILEAGLLPMLIHVEVSPLVPPPLVYRQGASWVEVGRDGVEKSLMWF